MIDPGDPFLIGAKDFSLPMRNALIRHLCKKTKAGISDFSAL